MAKYVLLVQLTDQGMRGIKDTTKRETVLKDQTAGKFGVKITEALWTLGQVDGVIVAEAPNDEAMAACSLSVAKEGNVRIQTLRAFDAAQMDALLAKV